MDMEDAHPLNKGICNLLAWQKSFRGHHEPAVLIKDGRSENDLLSSICRESSSPLRKQGEDNQNETSRNRLEKLA